MKLDSTKLIDPPIMSTDIAFSPPKVGRIPVIDQGLEIVRLMRQFDMPVETASFLKTVARDPK